MSKAVIALETLSCPSCLKKIENAVKGLNGIDQNSVRGVFNVSKIRIDFDEKMVTIEDVEKVIEDLGYPVIKSKVKAA
ncbi:metal-binding protein [Tetragenococcus halophilus subsp. flandriensis]|uniref:Metal-binding protein n=1 Tax=Tetragenococcus osmophilus TaxID=526944 RepID=A0ABM7ABW9_9ENTE|nr:MULTISPECIES: cation transporter [Tetragenococcus]AYW48963.1 metal-binding protein [Tetragenococcus osmophilus]AYW48997.1 metal-binding protein [Tetragenococcus osmophilus]GMA08370.1 metal-binding protein [Tetragenococcus halophilus subsp. flandriensis]